jgi:hypothetical protein
MAGSFASIKSCCCKTGYLRKTHDHHLYADANANANTICSGRSDITSVAERTCVHFAFAVCLQWVILGPLFIILVGFDSSVQVVIILFKVELCNIIPERHLLAASKTGWSGEILTLKLCK